MLKQCIKNKKMEQLLPSTSIKIKNTADEIGHPESCILSQPHFKINETDFYLEVKDVAHYRVQNGEKVSVCPHKDADQASVDLFLEGSTLGALLHQRKMLPFHGSSFAYKGKGITICGHSGAGKSSVTAAFCQQGAKLINDDITPVVVFNSQTTISQVKTRIKLWDDALKQLKIKNEGLQKIRPEINKYYLPSEEKKTSNHVLNQIFILTSHNKEEYVATELKGVEKYNALRQQIYRRVYLKGMPETEKVYFRQLFLLAKNIKVTVIIRPQKCDIYKTMRFIEKEMKQ